MNQTKVRTTTGIWNKVNELIDWLVVILQETIRPPLINDAIVTRWLMCRRQHKKITYAAAIGSKHAVVSWQM